MIDDRKGEGRFWATVVLAVVILLGVSVRDPQPSPKGEGASVEEFSAGRARHTLSRILKDELPHPTGSLENDLVRQRVIDEFRALGLEPLVEEALVCGDFGVCAIVRNVVAEIPGRLGGPAVLLNAHYDSVAASSGAGDDGAGVAALVETARALKTGPPPERPIRFLVDDGEEIGLLGAEAWVKSHPGDETLAVVVLEARGSSGPVLLFETNAGNLELIRAYARSVPDPATSSVFFSVYERLPNRTNFTVFKHEGYTGMAVAFIDDPAHYHTPLNDLENLSDASLQQMGDLTLALARELSTRGLGESIDNASYFDLLGATLIFWPEPWNVWLAITALVLVALAGVVAVRRERASAAQILLGWLVVLSVLLVAGGAGWLISRLSVMRSGDASWIANAGYLILACWCVAAAVTTLPWTLVRRAPSILSIWTSVWLLNGIAGVLVARLLPGAAYLFFIPALAAGLTGLVSLAGRRSERNEGMIIVPFIVSLLLVIPILDGLYTGLGLIALPGIAALAALTLLPLLVVSTEARRPALLTMAAVVGTIACVVAFALTPVFTAKVPRAMNVVAIQGPEGETSAVLTGSSDPIPAAIARAGGWSKQPVDAFRRSASAQVPMLWTAAMSLPPVDGPDLSRSTIDEVDGERRLRLVVRPLDPASVLRVLLPEGALATELSYGGHTVRLSPGLGQRFVLRGVPRDGLVLISTVTSGESVEVIEERAMLPSSIRAIADLRAETEVPIGPGDRSIVVTRLNVDDLPARSPAADAGLPPAAP